MRERTRYGGITSEKLETRLQQAIQSRLVEESRFREKHVHHWTVMFCDVSYNVSNAQELDEYAMNRLLVEYRDVVKNIIERFEPPFIAQDDGPQLLICFALPQHAADASILIQTELKVWRYRTDGGQHFRPSIGLHVGDFVVKDGVLQQSNACNLGKRIQTQAKSAQIFLSETAYEELKRAPGYELAFVKSALLKNIPEPQNIYVLSWQDSSAQILRKSAPRIESGDETEVEDSEIVDIAVKEEYMGVLICDVAGSTKKFWNLGDREGNQLIDAFRKEVTFYLKKYRAVHIENREGDMITALFAPDKPIMNVLAAIEIQKNFFRRNVNLGSRNREKIESSIGLHMGNMLIRNGKIVPTQDFLVCKGIQDQAKANDIFLTDTVRELIKDYAHFVWQESGETAIKGMETPVKIFALEWYRTNK